MSGPPEDATAAWMRQLYVLYVYAADHGTGAGRALLEAVIDSAEPAALWVADPSPRAQAFYRKHGFAADGTARFEDGVREIRMVRGVQHDGDRPLPPPVIRRGASRGNRTSRIAHLAVKGRCQVKPASRLPESGGADSSHQGESD